MEIFFSTTLNSLDQFPEYVLPPSYSSHSLVTALLGHIFILPLKSLIAAVDFRTGEKKKSSMLLLWEYAEK